jgi:lysophospholipase L1-like esterase
MASRSGKIQKTTFSQKIGLVVFGIILAAVLLELSLRLCGAVYLVYWGGADKGRRNGPDFYRILCLGDSFTRGIGADKGEDYPSHLERILNNGGFRKKFIVVNKGVPGQNSSELRYSLEGNLNYYRPDLVIVLTGMNDGHNAHLESWALHNKEKGPALYSFFTGLRIVKFIKLLGEMERKSRHKRKGGQDNLWALLEEAQKSKDYGTAEALMQKAIASRPRNPWYHFTLGKLYLTGEKFDEAEREFKYTLALDPRDNYTRFHLAEMYIAQGRCDKAESILKEEIRINGESHESIQLLMRCYGYRGTTPEGRYWGRKLLLYKEVDGMNLSAILRMTKGRGIKLMEMNYPERDSPRAGEGGECIFIDNRKTFGSMTGAEREGLFSVDKIHCSNKGYQVIAENIAETISKNHLFE